MTKRVITSEAAPSAIGTYSQAIASAGNTIYLSGQIGLDPKSMQLVEGIDGQIRQVFTNLKAVAEGGNATLANAVRVTIYLTDLAHFAKVNEAMAEYFPQPYPSRSTVGVSALPKGALVEVDAILVVPADGDQEPPIGAFRFRDDQA